MLGTHALDDPLIEIYVNIRPALIVVNPNQLASNRSGSTSRDLRAQELRTMEMEPSLVSSIRSSPSS